MDVETQFASLGDGLLKPMMTGRLEVGIKVEVNIFSFVLLIKKFTNMVKKICSSLKSIFEANLPSRFNLPMSLCNSDEKGLLSREAEA